MQRAVERKDDQLHYGEAVKTASAELQAFLASAASMYLADLYQITMADGTVLRFTDFDTDIIVGGQTYLASGPAIKRSRITQTIGLEVATLEINMLAAPTHQVNGTPILAALAKDRFAGAAVLLSRAYMPTPGDTSLGTVIKFGGDVADVEVKRASATITVKSITEKLDHMMPRHLIQPGCRLTLFDASCTLNEADWRVSGTVGSSSTRFLVQTNLTPPSGGINPPASAPTLSQDPKDAAVSPPQTFYAVVTYVGVNGETIASAESSIAMLSNHVVTVHSPASATGVVGWNAYVGTAPGDGLKQNQNPIAIGTNWQEPDDGLIQGVPPQLISTAGYYALGKIVFTSGANSGNVRSILGNTGGALSLKTGLPVAPASGDTFYVTPGDDKTKSTCQFKFNNLVHFGGFPYIPVPEAAI